MTLFPAVLVVATLFCTLVAGFLFAFAAVVMPGISRLEDGDFIRSFRAIDRVIQDKQPAFVLVWVGSALALVAAAAIGVSQLRGGDRLLLIVAAGVYLVGVQWPTLAINIPLNDGLQRLDPDALDPAARKRARSTFEAPWNRWNAIRAGCACLASLLLLLLLLRT